MNCDEVRAKWELFINGQCSSEEERDIEKHLHTCIHCNQLLNDELNNQQEELSFNEKVKGDFLNELPPKNQQKLIRKAKWKSRFMNVLTVFGIVLIISSVSTFLTGIYYFVGGEQSKGSKTLLVLKTVTQMTMPNVYVGEIGNSSNIFFNMDMSGSLQKDLGQGRKPVGDINGKMNFNRLNVDREWVGGEHEVKLFFLHPEIVNNQPMSEKKFYKETLNETWESLNRLPEGTVSELAVTFSDFYKIDEVYDMLGGYDLNIAWYAIDTGSEVNQESPYLSAVGGVWGIHESSMFDFIEDGGSIKVRGNGEKRAEIFKKGLHFLIKNQKLARQYKWDIEDNGPLEEMYSYVSENGVKTYGVVITGPTKELLKLQDNEHISYATLGDVDFWNWYNTPAGGTIYN